MQQLLTEILRRDFRPTQLRVLLVIANLTDGRNREDVQIDSIEDLARLCFSARPHVSAVVDELVSLAVLARDEKHSTWWIQPVDLWNVLPDERTSILLAATAGADEQRRQPEMFHQAHASEFLTAVRNSDDPTVRNSDDPLRARGQATRQPDQALSVGKGTGLDHAEFKLLDALVTWCSETGEACTPKQRSDWGWRIWTRGSALMADALRLGVQHVRAGKPTRSRFGLVKSIWQRLAIDDKVSPAPRSADRLHGANSAPPAGGVHASAPVAGVVGDGAPAPTLLGLKAAVLARWAQDASDRDGGTQSAMLPGEGSPAPRPGRAVRASGGDDVGAGPEDGR